MTPPPPSPVPALSQWECPTLLDASKKALNLHQEGGWKNITIIPPVDLTKSDRIVQAVKV